MPCACLFKTVAGLVEEGVELFQSGGLRGMCTAVSARVALFSVAMLAAGENVEVGDGRGSFKSRTVLEIGSFFHVSSSVQRLMRLLKYVYKITGLNTW